MAAGDGRWPGPIVPEASWRHWFGEAAVPPHGVVLLLFTLLLVAPLLGWEFGRLLRGAGAMVPAGGAIAAVTAVAAAIPMGAAISPGAAAILPVAAIVGILAIAGAIAVTERSRSIDGEDPREWSDRVLRGLAGVALAGAYGGGCLGGWIVLRQQESAWILAGGVLTVKSCDIGAYFIGSAIGRRKLAPRVSPGKTWEGLLGGVATAALVGGLLAAWSASAVPADAVPVWLGAMAGLLLGLAGQGGDLAESLLKRAAAAKDSSRLLPGLGGVFDVMDSLLPAGLLLAALLQLR